MLLRALKHKFTLELSSTLCQNDLCWDYWTMFKLNCCQIETTSQQFLRIKALHVFCKCKRTRPSFSFRKHRSLPDSDNTGELQQTFRSCCEISRNGQIIYLIHIPEFTQYCHKIYHYNQKGILINLLLNEISIFLLKK